MSETIIPCREKKARARAPNFSTKEQALLVECLDPYKNIIECNKTDHIKNSHKQEAWHKVTEKFNANTSYVSRTAENLMACYKNIKSRIKKERSSAKMILDDASEKVALVQSIEDYGKDWEAVSLNMKRPAETCKESFEVLQKEALKNENIYKKKIMGTGGGPPPDEDNGDTLNRIKKFIEPQIDGLYTSYDGDAGIMEEYMASLPCDEQILPIEYKGTAEEGGIQRPTAAEDIDISISGASEINDIIATPLIKAYPNRKHLLKKRKSEALGGKVHTDDTPKKKKVNETFCSLAEQKLELVALQKKSIEIEIEQKSLIQALQLEDLKKRNRHNDIMREKELQLMDLKIKKLLE